MGKFIISVALCASTRQHVTCLCLLEGLLLCAVVPIIIPLFGVRPIFKARTTAFYFFVFFLFFSKWILLLLVRVKHRRTLYRFLLSKIEGEIGQQG